MAFTRMKEWKDLELEYDAPSGMEVTVYTDFTGNTQGVVASRAVLEFPATTGRATYTLGLDGIFGTLIRFKITSAGIVRLYGGIVRARSIGVFFNGANGEIWTSQEMGIGIG